MTALNHKLLRDLVHLRGQMIAVVLVVACGIATYVTMASVYESLLATRTAYYDRYRFADVFATVKRAPDNLLPSILAIPGIASVRTRIVVDVTLDIPGLGEPATGRIVSVPDRRAPMLNDLYIRSGHYIEPKAGDQVMMSEAFAQANGLEVGDSLGAVINGRWKRLRIVGVALSPEYVYEVTGLLPDNKHFGVLWMGHDALSAAFDMTGAFNDLAARLSPEARTHDVLDRLDHLLEGYGSLGAYDRSDQLSHHFLEDELAQLEADGLYIPIIFLGVAAFLLHIVLSRLVATQRDQIAVLKAFGYSNTAVGYHYAKFALVAVLVGAAIGIAAGWWLGTGMTTLYAKYYRFPLLRYAASETVMLYALLIGVGSAVLGTLSAVRKAIALPPAEAMRPEMPARFKPGILERLGFQRLLSTSTRIILRSLERNPWKSFLSILGIALSVAILVVGHYSFDAIIFLFDLQFNTVDRSDVTVIFAAPRSGRASQEVMHLPAVLRSESFRTVPVRLRSGHRTRRLAIQGVEADGDLRRLIDRDYRHIPLPSNGMVLTTKLAEILDVKAGDSLTVEILEGERMVTRIVVADLVDELLGLSAYMEIGTLNRLMKEGATVSGAYLSVDRQQRQLLYSTLKRTPAIAGTSIREAAIDSFNKAITENQGISRTALIIFASIIAFGIVYNSARISLSERGRELSSLRVLGFTNRETSIILLGEQALLTLLALPVGFLIGYGICSLLTNALSGEMYRMPLVVSSEAYASAALTVIIAAVVSGYFVRRRLVKLDMVEVLKTRE